MYKFLEHLEPHHVSAIAAQVFMEMQEAGFAAVGEFHYVHHRKGGGTYDNLAELSERVCEAAKLTGIGLTHLPVLYTYGGAGEKPLSGGQLRFGNSLERFLKLHNGAIAAAKSLPPDARVGFAPHSLRAVSPSVLKGAVAAIPEGPLHIHVAEQPREVEEISTWLGARPVEWLLQNMRLSSRWCLIHATHMTVDETKGMARSGAVAGLCPVTEANLGDGPFNGTLYLNEGGAFGVGSDSNVRISLAQELSTLEYSQRLKELARNVLVVGEGSVGQQLYVKAAEGGATALGRNAGQIAEGRTADLVAIRTDGAVLTALKPRQFLDGWIFAEGDRIVSDVWSAGRHCVKDGCHIARDQVSQAYRKAIASLTAAL
jgi:formiminoglutamate deiminase